jgi:hypothetical protein
MIVKGTQSVAMPSMSGGFG